MAEIGSKAFDAPPCPCYTARAMRSFVRVFLLPLMLCALWPAPRARAQETALAVILAPLEGAIVSGRAPITGTATHPQFQRYELAFGYSPNPTDTWFSIQDPAQTQIVNDVLGDWDTSGITDGLYTLRLRVYWSDRDFLEAVVRNVRVQNAQPTLPPPTDTPVPLPTAIEPTLTPAATLPAINLPPTFTPPPTANAGAGAEVNSTSGTTPRLNGTLIGEAFLAGVRLTVICFAFLGAYAGLQALWRRRPRR